jgi:Uma2 family endonuclease
MLQAKGFDTQSNTSYTPPTVTEGNRFPYGWRYVTKQLPTGEESYDQIPLTANDLLNPQLGDQVPQNNVHFQVIVDLVATLKTYYANDSSMGVFGDLIMDWGIAGLSGPAPDIAIIPKVKQKEVDRGTFKVAQEGTRPCLVIEVMSPGYPGDDTAKVKIYERAGIAEYFLIKPRVKRGVAHYELRGYRLTEGVYQPIPPAGWGTVLLSQTLQLRFEVENQGRQVRITEVQTGQRLLTPTETEEARLAAEARATMLETARQQEQAARLAAEVRAQAAETRAQTEATARTELETRLRELENLLQSRTE